MKPRHLERVDWSPNATHPPDTTAWTFTIPAIAQLITQGGLDIAPGVTFVVGDGSRAVAFRGRAHRDRFAIGT